MDGVSITAFNHGTSPDLDKWLYADLDNGKHSTEMQMTILSGGSAGLTASGIPLGIDKTGLSGAISLYPNPAHTRVTVRIDSRAAFNGSLTIVNMYGQILKKQKIEHQTGETDYDFDIREMVSGTYIMLIQANGHSESIRFVKDE